MKKSWCRFCLIVSLLCAAAGVGYAQPTWTFEPFGKEKKPEQYEEKLLPSEKTATKKFTPVRRFIQNNTTHYNFYFNANNRLNAVLERARIANKDDYNQLLPFYGYSLDQTAAQRVELDSVIYKSTAAILLHDLRSDWVDNMYLLIGKSYYLRKQFDSAAMTFQFINYNLFPRKKNEEDSRVVGSNLENTGGALSIADKEKRNVVQKILTLPPSRNDALIWLARTFTETEQFADAAGMINILQYDPNLPKRLKNDLEEVTAYWFYKQNMYDSSARHLELALSNAPEKQDKARWEYLLGQLYELSGQQSKASFYYSKSAKHTVDPVMDIHARLNDAKLYKENGDKKELQNTIDNLLKMARKDKYEAYRDIIYYAAGDIAIDLPDTAHAVEYLHKSTRHNENNAEFKNKAFRDLGNIAYSEAQYKSALNAYDSLDLAHPILKNDSAMLDDRRKNLRQIVAQIDIITLEDSLQLIAKMPAAERDAFIKKLSKKLRKEKGSKEETGADAGTGSAPIAFNNDKSAPADLFDNNSKGEWYFYNASMKSRGYNDFKTKWGKRENVDNWRRKSAADANVLKSKNPNIDIDDPLNSLNAKPEATKESSGLVPNSFDALMANIPLTEEKIDSSNERIARAMLELARIFQFNLEDYPQAIQSYEIYLERFPKRLENGEVYLGLYYCYSKLGNQERANYYKNLINSQFSDSRTSKLINNPLLLTKDKKNPEVTARYESIYGMFLEGKFEQAIAEKQQADSLYGENYWSPQLLYIETLYHVKNHNDSIAKVQLNNIIRLYPNSALKPKAVTLLDVLSRRAEIEAYLTNLQVTRAEEDQYIISNDQQAVVIQQAPKTDEPKRIVAAPTAIVRRPDSIQVLAPNMVSGAFKWQSEKPHLVMMILEKTDPVYVNEAKNAFGRFNRQRYASQTININKDALNADKALLLFSSFPTADAAVQYYEAIKKAAPSEVSWLPANKYSFLVISETNLQLLKTNGDLNSYKTLLNNQYPGKF
jgi:tetratricopeptide (TPR) repeat protein